MMSEAPVTIKGHAEAMLVSKDHDAARVACTVIWSIGDIHILLLLRTMSGSIVLPELGSVLVLPKLESLLKSKPILTPKAAQKPRVGATT